MEKSNAIKAKLTRIFRFKLLSLSKVVTKRQNETNKFEGAFMKN